MPRRAKSSRVQKLLRAFETGAQDEADRFVAVVDSSVLWPMATSRSPASHYRALYAIAVAGVFDSVSSSSIRDEISRVLASVGHDPAHLDHFWEVTRFVDPVPDDPSYHGVVSDPDDLHVLRTAATLLTHPAYATRPGKFLVSDNTRHFPERNWHGIRFVTAIRFLSLLKDP